MSARPRLSPVARVIAVDWSGALAGAARKIWLCEVDRGEVVRLENGRSREALADEVVEAARRSPRLAVGFDFAFSLPAWFLADRGLADVHALWRLAAAEGERWLTEPVAPFWGRAGVKRPEMPAETRLTEREAGARAARRPSSVFKLVGPDQVGAGSVRGMATLARLAAEGFAVWPFDDPAPGRPVAVEIWPRLLYAEPVTKSSEAARAAYLAAHAPALGESFREAATASDDAFDALTAALAMWDRRASLARLPRAASPEVRLEGWIWGEHLPA